MLNFLQNKIFTIVILGLFWGVNFSFAQTAPSPDLQSLIRDLQAQIQALQTQVRTLEQELGKSPEVSSTPSLVPASSQPTTSQASVSVIPSSQPEASPPELTRSLARGSSGDDVRRLQEFLAKDKEIYPNGLITGFFGPLTEVAVKKWQEKHNIESVGIVGPKTIAKLQDIGKGVIQGLLQQGAGSSGVIPPGLQKKTENPITTQTPSGTIPAQPIGLTGTTTIPAVPFQTSTSTATTTPSGTIPAIPATPAVPTVPATPTSPAVPATPAVSATPAVTTATSTTPDITAPVISNMQAVNITSNSLTVTWTTNEASDSQVEYGLTSSYGSSTPLDTSMVTSHSVLLSNLRSSTSYQIKVKSKDAAGNVSAQSNVASVTTLAITVIYTQPTSVTATLGAGKITLSWPDSGAPLYCVYRSVNGGSFPTGACGVWVGSTLRSGSTYTYDDTHVWGSVGDTAFVSGYFYKYKVFGCSGNYTCEGATGTESNSVTYGSSNSVAPNASPVFTRTVNGSTVLISWASIMNASYYKIDRQIYGGGGTWSSLSANITGLSYSDSPGPGTFTYRMFSCNTVGCYAGYSANNVTVSSVDTSAPSKPTNFTATASGSNVNLSWTDNATNETEYRVTQLSTNNDILAQISLSANTTSYVHSGVAAGTYKYQVNAYNGIWSSLTSDQVTVTVASPPVVSVSIPALTEANFGSGGSAPSYEGTYGMSARFTYSGTISDVQSFRFYHKRPGDGSFSLASTFTNPSSVSPASVSSGTCSARISSNGWNLNYCPSTATGYESIGGFWSIDGIYASPTSFPVGEYNSYVTAVGAAGNESSASAQSRHIVLDRTTVSSPTQGQTTSITPTFRWNIASGWPLTPYYWLVFYDSTQTVWTSSVPVTLGSTQGSKLYNGPALDPAKTYNILIRASMATSDRKVTYMSMQAGVTTFNVSTTASSLDARTKSLAAISKALNEINEKLLKLLQNL